MPPSTPSTSPSIENTRPTLKKQSSKRHNSEPEVELDEIMCKRTCRQTLISCPLACIGCLSKISEDDLEDHYKTQIHQEFFMKLINSLKQQSHTQSNLEDSSDIIEAIDILQNSMTCLQDDAILIQNNIVKTQNTVSEQVTQIKYIQNSIEETNQIVQASQMNMNMLETELEELKQKIEELQSQSSNDGSFIWKITDVAKKLKDAIAEKQTSFYSPPFYSSSTGYKMCLRLYLYGDGHVRGTHCSLFFVIMRGNYDNILQWPFTHKVIFCLYDQSGNQNHIIDSFNPDIKSTSFQQPRSNMNIASGIPKFCKLETLQQQNNPYIRNDCMFIRCIVNFASTPKIILPFVCSINPGLPILNQRMLIRAEIDRQTKLTSDTTKN